MAQRTGIDELEFDGTWTWSNGNDYYTTCREITDFFLDSTTSPVAVRVTSLASPYSDGEVQYTAVADLEDRSALERVSADGNLRLAFYDRK